MATLSFCYAPPISSQYKQYTSDTNLSDLKETCVQVMKTNACQIVFTTTDTNNPMHSIFDTPTDYNLTLSGSVSALLQARSDLLSNSPLKIQLAFSITLEDFLRLSKHKADIETKFNTTIQFINPPRQNSLTSESMNQLHLIGKPLEVEQCRVYILVLLDEMKSLKTEALQLPLNLQYLICGRKRMSLLPILTETATTLYFPCPFERNEPAIYITGESNHVSRVKDMLNKLAVQKAKSMYHKDSVLYSRKIDWLLLHRQDELRKIMHDNGAYIQFPQVGSGDNRIIVCAENRVNAERTLRALNFQASSIYEACFYFNQPDEGGGGDHAFDSNNSNMTYLVTQLSKVSGSEVVFKHDPGSIEVLGTERAIRNVYQTLQDTPLIQTHHKYTVFRVESSNDQRDFISGKKNGKINKIMKTSGAKIKFIPFINDYNFVIEVESTSFTKALDGLTLMQEELPAEISFYVPESYHKRIIGVGGKNIQRIMKKYGVYVKFSNTEEFASLGGYYSNQDNVVARTPMKNQINLDNLRHAVLDLVNPKDRSYITQVVQIPFYLHKQLIHKYQDNMLGEDLLKKTNTQIFWPDAELASDTVELLGPQANLPLAIQILKSVTPVEYDIHVPISQHLSSAVQTEAYQKNIVSVISHELNIKLTFMMEHMENDPVFRLSTMQNKVNTDLPKAMLLLVDFLKRNQVPLYEDTEDSIKKLLLSESASEMEEMMMMETVPAKAPQSSIGSSLYANPETMYEEASSSTSPPMYPFFQRPPPSNETSGNYPIENWNVLRQGPSPSSSAKSDSSRDDNLRAIFNAPIEITEKDRIMMPNYRYPLMPPAASNTASDIWSAPSLGGGNKRQSNEFAPTSFRHSPFPTTNGPNLPRMFESNPGFYPMMGIPPASEFNPYGEPQRPTQSVSDSVIDSHFSHSFHPSSSADTFHYHHDAKKERPMCSENKDDLHLGTSSSSDQEKGSRPPPGIDI
ncbi:hypothetical protein K501DRAFT_219857 [Backusella circina FSU 941]|nr:hypothetical protein K501DRAFT_219857 [Backusella circina FSU 941]